MTKRQLASVRARLRRVIAGFGGPIALANRLNAPENRVRHWLRGRNFPGSLGLYQLAQLGVNPDWLLFGGPKPPKFPYATPNHKGQPK